MFLLNFASSLNAAWIEKVETESVVLMIDDQRKYTAFLVGWLVVLVLLFCVYGNFEFKYGPNPNLLFINIPVNNWYIWSLLAVFLVCDKFVCSYVGNTQGAWITNTIYNEKQVEIMYSKFSCQIITTVFTGFYSFRAVFFIYLGN